MKKYLILLLFLFFITGCDVSKVFEPQYKKLIIQQPDGTHKVFVGQSVSRMGGTTYYITKDRQSHEVLSPHWITHITKKEFDDFGKTAEQEPKDGNK